MVSVSSPFKNILSFGAVSGGNTFCTKAFAAAVEACAGEGGGTVYVPAGTYLTGPVHLKSNITLYLEAGARVVFAGEQKDYTVVFSRWEGVEQKTYSPMIFGEKVENVTITGRGVLDGRGDYWWTLFREKKLAYPRPRFIVFQDSRDIAIENIKLINAPSWTVNPIRCENITIHNVTIKNPPDSPNTDGINPESCKNVHIANCHIDVGDDCIAVKSGTEENSLNIPCANITITNCTMLHGHGGVVIGSEMSGGIRNVVISNCIFEGTDRGIRIKSRRGRGGIVEDIRVSNLVMTKVICPFIINLFYHCGPGGKDRDVQDKNPQAVTEKTPVIRDIHYNNISARQVKAAAGFIYGLPEKPVANISFNNVSVTMTGETEPGYPAMMNDLEPMKQKGFFCCHGRNVQFSNMSISGQEGPEFMLSDLKNCRN